MEHDIGKHLTRIMHSNKNSEVISSAKYVRLNTYSAQIKNLFIGLKLKLSLFFHVVNTTFFFRRILTCGHSGSPFRFYTL